MLDRLGQVIGRRARLALWLAVSSASFVTATGAACSETCPRKPDHRLDGIRTDTDAERLLGLTRAEVIAKLGPPTSPSLDPGGDMNYWLRPQGFCMDGWYLALDLEDERVVRARVVPG